MRVLCITSMGRRARVVRQIRDLHAAKSGMKRIGSEVGIARNTVRRYRELASFVELEVHLTEWSMVADAR